MFDSFKSLIYSIFYKKDTYNRKGTYYNNNCFSFKNELDKCIAQNYNYKCENFKLIYDNCIKTNLNNQEK